MSLGNSRSRSRNPTPVSILIGDPIPWRYLPHIDNRPPSPDPEDFLRMLISLSAEKPATRQ